MHQNSYRIADYTTKCQIAPWAIFISFAIPCIIKTAVLYFQEKHSLNPDNAKIKYMTDFAYEGYTAMRVICP